MHELTEALSDALKKMLEDGRRPPFLFTAVGINGSIMAVRYTEGDEGLDAEVLVSKIQGTGGQRGMQLPINCMIVDSAGDAMRVLIGFGGVSYH